MIMIIMNNVMESKDKECVCLKCNHRWFYRVNGLNKSNKSGLPLACSRCKSYKWREEVIKQ